MQDRLPSVFYPEQNPKYEGVLFDFKYLKVCTALRVTSSRPGI